MKYILILIILITAPAYSDSIYVSGGPSYGTFYTEENFVNLIVGYEKHFSDKWSVAGEFQYQCRNYPESGNLYSFGPTFRYYLIDTGTWKAPFVAGFGLAVTDYDYASHGDLLFHSKLGLEVERRISWLSLYTGIYHDHFSNGGTAFNPGRDAVMFAAGVRFIF